MEAGRTKQVLSVCQTAMIAHTHPLSSCSQKGDQIEASGRKKQVVVEYQTAMIAHTHRLSSWS